MLAFDSCERSSNPARVFFIQLFLKNDWKRESNQFESILVDLIREQFFKLILVLLHRPLHCYVEKGRERKHLNWK